MTFGPWLVTAAPVAVPVAVVDRFFHTICASWATVSALASTTRVTWPGWRGLLVPGTWPTFHTTRLPLSTPPPAPVAMRVKVVPSTGGAGPRPPSAGAAAEVLAVRREG